MLGLVNKDVNVDENDLMITPELANCLLVQTGMIIMNLLYDQQKRDGYYTKKESIKAIDQGFKHGTNSILECGCKAHESIETFKDHTQGAIL